MDSNLLLKKITQHYKKELPFVIYSFPESEIVQVLLQKDRQLHAQEELSESGFVFAPFDYKNSVFYIPENLSDVLEGKIESIRIASEMVEIEKNTSEKINYKKLLQNTIETIRRRKAVKIVVSRFQDFALKDFSVEILIKQLFSSYPTAFRYVWYHPETGLWCGATPEILVEINDSFFKTMALAGTQAFNDIESVLWSPKEIDEQQLVTDAIVQSLQKVTSVLKISNAHTQRAGNLLHLRTDITGVLKNGKATLTKIIAVLHPTPAVCGTPQRFAKEYILENEGYQREFYTGFLGPVSIAEKAATIMVNLRCMKISEKTARIYVGGGITTVSEPESEYQETRNKMQTMLQVLQPMLEI